MTGRIEIRYQRGNPHKASWHFLPSGAPGSLAAANEPDIRRMYILIYSIISYYTFGSSRPGGHGRSPFLNPRPRTNTAALKNLYFTLLFSILFYSNDPSIQ